MDENTQQTGTEPTDADLMALALQADAGEISSDEPLETAEPETSEAPAEEPVKKDDPKPGDKPAEGKPNEPADKDKGPETKPEGEDSAYTKARKEQERQDRSWKKLEEEKATLRAEQEKIAKDRQELESKKSKESVYRDDKGYSAEDYENFAGTTDDPELAKKAREKAAAVRKQESDTRTQTAQNDFAAGWKKNLDEVIAENKELEDQNSDLGKAVTQVLKDQPVFSLVPDGIKHAVAFAKLQRQAGLVSGLEAKVKELETENARLNKLTSIPGSGPTQKPGVKTLDEMTSAEADAELERMAAEADRVGV